MKHGHGITIPCRLWEVVRLLLYYINTVLLIDYRCICIQLIKLFKLLITSVQHIVINYITIQLAVQKAQLCTNWSYFNKELTISYIELVLFYPITNKQNI